MLINHGFVCHCLDRRYGNTLEQKKKNTIAANKRVPLSYVWNDSYSLLWITWTAQVKRFNR
jgi:hypothetical protein